VELERASSMTMDFAGVGKDGMGKVCVFQKLTNPTLPKFK
jgi:hypothetical protein